MEYKFILKNIEEDDIYIYLYIGEKYEEKNITDYIKGIYINNNMNKYIFYDIVKDKNLVICKMEKEYLSEIVNYNNEKMLIEIGIDLHNEVMKVGILYENFECWFWKENEFYIVSDSEEIYLCNTTEQILELKTNFEGSYRYINENNGVISITDCTINLNAKKILDQRKFNCEINYELAFRSRKDKINICNITKFSINNSKLEFVMKESELNMLGGYSNIYDVYLILSIKNYKTQVRIKSKNISILPNICYGINKFYELRAYTTQDGFLSFIIKTFEPKIEIENLKIDSKRINISGKLLELSHCKMNIGTAYIQDNKKRKHNIDILYRKEVNDDNSINFNIKINIDDLMKGYIKDKKIFNIIIELQLFGKEVPYILKYNNDNIVKEDCIVYPSIKKVINNEALLITPKYYNQDLVIEVERNFNLKITFEKMVLKCKYMRFICQHNLKVDISSLSLKVDFIDRNNENKLSVDSHFNIDDGKIVFDIPVGKIEKLNFDEEHKIKVNLYNDRTNIYKDISTKFIPKYKRYNTNLSSLLCKKILFVILENDGGLYIKVKDIMNLHKISKLKYKLAKKCAMFTKIFYNKSVWLVGENLGDTAQDNGFAFFEYCINNKKNKNVFYIGKRNNKDKDKLELYKKKVLRYNSFKHFFYYELSQYLIVSHGIRDVMPSIFHNNINKNKKDIIYLQHGIIAMKKIYFNRKSYNNKILKFIVASDREKEILVNKMNFDEGQVVITGLARFDKLYNKNIKEKTILVMPTWRDWIINNRETFISSSFYKTYTDLLRDGELNQILKENNIKLKFYPHIEIQKRYIDLFENMSDNINIVKLGEEKVQDLIKECVLMITDYSSVALDFNYLRKPVIFYQFDLDEYTHYRGSFIDLKTQLPGDICNNSDEVINCIKKYINNNFKYNEQYLKNSDNFYKYRDTNNCERIYYSITR